MAQIRVIDDTQGGNYLPDVKILSRAPRFNLNQNEQVVIAYNEVRSVGFEKIHPLVLFPRAAAVLEKNASDQVYARGVEIRDFFFSPDAKASDAAVTSILDNISSSVDAQVVYMYVTRTEELCDVLLQYGFEKSSQVFPEAPEKDLLYLCVKKDPSPRQEIYPRTNVKKRNGAESNQNHFHAEKKQRRMCDGDLSYEMDSDEERAEKAKAGMLHAEKPVEKKKDWFIPSLVSRAVVMEEEEEEVKPEGDRTPGSGGESVRKYTNVKLQPRFFGHFQRTGNAILTRPGDEKWKTMLKGDYIMFNTPDGKAESGIITEIKTYAAAEDMIAAVCSDRINAGLNLNPEMTLNNFLGIFECKEKVEKNGCFAFHVKKSGMPGDTRYYAINNANKQQNTNQKTGIEKHRFY
jgi:ASC-1-like (ASCH) protein